MIFYGAENLRLGLDQNILPPMAPVFLHISSKLPRKILERLCVYCKNLLGLCFRKCGNSGALALVSSFNTLSNWFKMRTMMRDHLDDGSYFKCYVDPTSHVANYGICSSESRIL